MHAGADGFVTGAYLHDEFMRDLVGVTGQEINRDLAELTISESASIIEWMVGRGAHWQAPLKGTLGLARTNHFFLGGGKSLLNAWYRAAQAQGIVVHYDTSAIGLDFDGSRIGAVLVRLPGGDEQLVEADAVIVAAGGFEANRSWLAEYWGDAAYNFVVRGTANNDGAMLRLLLDAGARSVGDPKGVHAIAVDARSPRYDAGIITRLDAIPIGIAVNVNSERFYDEGEDIWPKRYATWGRLIAEQPDQRYKRYLVRKHTWFDHGPYDGVPQQPHALGRTVRLNGSGRRLSVRFSIVLTEPQDFVYLRNHPTQAEL